MHCQIFRSLEKRANTAVSLISDYLLKRIKNGVSESTTSSVSAGGSQFEKMANLTWGNFYIVFGFIKLKIIVTY